MASFAPKPGCPLCSIASTPFPSLLQTPRRDSFSDASRNGNPLSKGIPPQIVYKDDKITAYLEKANPVSSKGHLVIVLNLHVPSLYLLSSGDIPLLLHIRSVAQNLLTRHLNGSLSVSSSQPLSPQNINPETPDSHTLEFAPEADPSAVFNIGFIVSPFYDPQIPVSDHVHCHAYIGTLDKAGWWRKLNYSGMGWYGIDDLVAEIREQTSNNRVKSGHEGRYNAPIDNVPDAGARTGYSNGLEMPQSPIGGALSPSSGADPLGSPNPVPAVAVTPEATGTGAESGEPQSTDDTPAPATGTSPTPSRPTSVSIGKRPMGPRSNTTSSGNIQLAQVGSGATTPEQVEAA